MHLLIGKQSMKLKVTNCLPPSEWPGSLETACWLANQSTGTAGQGHELSDLSGPTQKYPTIGWCS